MLTEESIEHIRGIVAEHGSDAWWEMKTADLLPPVRLYLRLYLIKTNVGFAAEGK